jgi:putative oxidoreductase
LSPFLAFLARALLAAIFLVSGLRKALAFSATAQMLAGKGFPAPEFVLVLTILLEVGGGLLLVLNWQARAAAVVLALFTLAAGVIFHDFWTRPPEELTNQMNHFLKNIAIVGGLLHVAAAAPLERVNGSTSA